VNTAVGADPTAPTRAWGGSDGGADNRAGGESGDERAGSPIAPTGTPAPTGPAPPPSTPPDFFNRWRKRLCASGRGKSESCRRGDLHRQHGNGGECAYIPTSLLCHNDCSSNSCPLGSQQKTRLLRICFVHLLTSRIGRLVTLGERNLNKYSPTSLGSLLAREVATFSPVVKVILSQESIKLALSSGEMPARRFLSNSQGDGNSGLRGAKG
jgi:hypothetical protein